MRRPKNLDASRRSQTFRPVSDDSISPTFIQHVCDELWFGDKLEQRYNFLNYVFDDARARILARAYLDHIHVVTVFPAFLRNSACGPSAEVEAPELRAAV